MGAGGGGGGGVEDLEKKRGRRRAVRNLSLSNTVSGQAFQAEKNLRQTAVI